MEDEESDSVLAPDGKTYDQDGSTVVGWSAGWKGYLHLELVSER